jgi:hypothetical protein
MKAVTAVVAILMVAAFAGCTDQDSMTGPVSSQDQVTMTKPFTKLPISSYAFSPDGRKFFVSGWVHYNLSDDGKVAISVSASAAWVGFELAFPVTGGRDYQIDPAGKGEPIVVQELPFEASGKVFVPWQLQVTYFVEGDAMSITSVRILSGDAF